jgi:hypothetical protein
MDKNDLECGDNIEDPSENPYSAADNVMVCFTPNDPYPSIRLAPGAAAASDALPPRDSSAVNMTQASDDEKDSVVDQDTPSSISIRNEDV